MFSLGPQCIACRFTKRLLERHKISYTEVRVDEDTEALQRLQHLGYTRAPVVQVDLGDGASCCFDGYRPGQIEALAQLL